MEIYPSVSIIVPVFNGGDFLHKCIISLLNIDYPKQLLEIIFVDNKSTDNTKNIIKSYPVKYLLQAKEKGENPTVLYGIKHSSGDIVAITDADCVVAKAWIKELINVYWKDEKVGGVGGEIKVYHPKTRLEVFQEIYDDLPQKRNLNLGNPGIHCLVGSNISYRKEVLSDTELEKALKSYPIAYGKDLVISSNILLKGYKLAYAPRAIVYHKLRNNYRAILKQSIRYGCSFECAVLTYGHSFQDINFHSIKKNLLRSVLLFVEAFRWFSKEVFKNRRLFASPYYTLSASKELFLAFGRIYMKSMLYVKNFTNK